PITAFSHQVTPIGRLIRIVWPGGGFVWHYPVAIEVQQQGIMRRMPIRNVTRRAMITIFLTGLAIATLVRLRTRWLSSQRRRMA
ncbi:MAG: hypothetical protein ACJ788_20050, partial [Ktedonobacteraceae bacterium]